MWWTVHRNDLYGVRKCRPLNTSVLFACCWRGKDPASFLSTTFSSLKYSSKGIWAKGPDAGFMPYIELLFFMQHLLSSQNDIKANLTSLRGMGWGVGCPSGHCRWWECPWSVPGHGVLEHSWLLLDCQVQDPQCCKGYLKLLSAYESTFRVGLPDQWRAHGAVGFFCISETSCVMVPFTLAC